MQERLSILMSHLERMQAKYPDEQLVMLLDFEGSVIDLTTLLDPLLRDFDAQMDTELSTRSRVKPQPTATNRLADLLATRALTSREIRRLTAWYNSHFRLSGAEFGNLQTFKGVLPLLEYLQTQERVTIGINTSRPEMLRLDTRTFLRLAAERAKLTLADPLLALAPDRPFSEATSGLAANTRYFQEQGFRIFAVAGVCDTDAQLINEIDADREILVLPFGPVFDAPAPGRHTPKNGVYRHQTAGKAALRQANNGQSTSHRPDATASNFSVKSGRAGELPQSANQHNTQHLNPPTNMQNQAPAEQDGTQNSDKSATQNNHCNPPHNKQGIDLAWARVNDIDTLHSFLDSSIRWAEMDVCQDPMSKDLILRRNSFTQSPLQRHEDILLLEVCLYKCRQYQRGIKLDFKDGGKLIPHVIEVIKAHGFPDRDLWFNGHVERFHEDGFRLLANAFPNAAVQCPIHFMEPTFGESPAKALEILTMLRSWGVRRFSINWLTPNKRELIDHLSHWGFEVNIYNVPDHNSFVQALHLLPRSISADFNVQRLLRPPA